MKKITEFIRNNYGFILIGLVLLMFVLSILFPILGIDDVTVFWLLLPLGGVVIVGVIIVFIRFITGKE